MVALGWRLELDCDGGQRSALSNMKFMKQPGF